MNTVFSYRLTASFFKVKYVWDDEQKDGENTFNINVINKILLCKHWDPIGFENTKTNISNKKALFLESLFKIVIIPFEYFKVLHNYNDKFTQ